MKSIWLACTISICLAEGASAHKKKCDEFPTYTDAVNHCKNVPPHVWPTNCGNHDRDKDGRPCECRPGGAKVDTNACKSKRKK